MATDSSWPDGSHILGSEITAKKAAEATRATMARTVETCSKSTAAAGLFLALAAFLIVGTGCSTPDEREPFGRPIILIVVDTLRADHLGAYGQTRPTSPRIDEWAESGRLFEVVLSTAPWTAPAFGTLFTGQMPSRHGVLGQERPDGRQFFGQLDSGVRTLAELLSDHGYTTAAMVNNPFLNPEFGLDRGFELYDYAFGNNAGIRRAEEMVDLAVGWIDRQQDAPFFLVLHLFDPHMNYDAPEPFHGRFTDDIPSQLELPVEELNAIRAQTMPLDKLDRQFIRAAYDEEIAYVDHELDRFLEALEQRGLLERGLVLFTSDHGEELFDHGGFEHGHALWQELIHVPLIAWGAGVRPGRVTTPVSLVDVAPTLLEFAGVELTDEVEGRSLLDSLRGGNPPGDRTLYAEQNLYGTELKTALDWPYKLIVNPESGDRWLFDLDANPGERLLPWDEHAEKADDLQRALLQRLERDLAARTEQTPAELGSDTLEQLRSLGYVR